MHNTNADRDLAKLTEQLSEVIRLLSVIAENTTTTTTTRRRTSK